MNAGEAEDQAADRGRRVFEALITEVMEGPLDRTTATLRQLLGEVAADLKKAESAKINDAIGRLRLQIQEAASGVAEAAESNKNELQARLDQQVAAIDRRLEEVEMATRAGFDQIWTLVQRDMDRLDDAAARLGQRIDASEARQEQRFDGLETGQEHRVASLGARQEAAAAAHEELLVGLGDLGREHHVELRRRGRLELLVVGLLVLLVLLGLAFVTARSGR